MLLSHSFSSFFSFSISFRIIVVVFFPLLICMNLRINLLYVTLSMCVCVCVCWQIFHWIERDYFGRELPSSDHCLSIYEHGISLPLFRSSCCILTFFICTLLWRNTLLLGYVNDFAKPSFLELKYWVTLSVFPFFLCWFNSCFPFSCTLWYLHSYGLPVGTFQMLPDPWTWKMERYCVFHQNVSDFQKKILDWNLAYRS